MATKVLFHRVVQDSKEFGSTEAISISRVFFDLDDGIKSVSNLHVDVNEAVGSTHQDDEINVGKPVGVSSSIDQPAFAKAVRNYYQSLVNSAGFGKHLAKDKGFRTFGDNLVMEQVIQL